MLDPPVRSIVLPAEIVDVINEMLTRQHAGMVALHIANGRIGAFEMKRQLPARKLTTPAPQS